MLTGGSGAPDERYEPALATLELSSASSAAAAAAAAAGSGARAGEEAVAVLAVAEHMASHCLLAT